VSDTVAELRARLARSGVDGMLITAVLALLGLGLVMVASASVAIADRKTGEPFYYLWRQLAFLAVGIAAAWPILRTPLVVWEENRGKLLLMGMGLLVAVLMPGIGVMINGSHRWLHLGLFNLQVSELMKLLLIVYLAGYLVRRGDEVRRSATGFLKPLALLAVICGLLLAEPDFGAAVVMTAVCLGLMLLGGVRLWHFGMLLVLVVAALAALAITSPYRLARLVGFLNPWSDPFASGFQLTQALIAFGRGEWLGVGLGGGVQKLFYLPEAHTDFLLAVIAEELGFLGVFAVVGLFGFITWRAFTIARNALAHGADFAGYCAYGVGLWLALQAYVNVGVNMGVLPTKGLTLPLMSYGGSSMVVSCMAIALLLRVEYETRGNILYARDSRTSAPHR
jgi:cell division protein FtsW